MNLKPAGYAFDSLQPALRQARQLAHDTCRQFNRAPSKGHLKKLKSLFKECQPEIFIEAGFFCDYGQFISIGARSYININCTLLDGGSITLGDDVMLGPNVQIITINHATCPKERQQKASFAQDVVLGNNVWVGAGAIILPGVTIGDGAVIGAGSLVNRNVAANTLVAGNPATMIKSLL